MSLATVNANASPCNTALGKRVANTHRDCIANAHPNNSPSATWFGKGICALSLLLVGLPAFAQTWDIKTDWSDAINPNGVWSYREGSNALPSIAAFEGSGFSSVPQPGWARSGTATNRLPFWFKSQGNEVFSRNFIAGDVVVHSTDPFNGVGSGLANAVWRSPVTGAVNVTGGVWIGREIGRSSDWRLLLNGVVLTGGNVASGDAFDRTNPFLFSLGSGGSSILNNLAVRTGDELQLQFNSGGAQGDFVGVNFRVVNASVVPETGSLVLLSFAVAPVTFALVRRRRRK